MRRTATWREERLYPQVGRFLENRGWRVAFEVQPRPGSSREFDVVGVKTRRNLVVVVEAKRRSHKRTIEQALGRMYLADFVYISFPAPYARKVLEEHAREVRAPGLGLLALDGFARELIAPRKSRYVDTDRKAQLIAMVTGKETNHG